MVFISFSNMDYIPFIMVVPSIPKVLRIHFECTDKQSVVMKNVTRLKHAVLTISETNHTRYNTHKVL